MNDSNNEKTTGKKRARRSTRLTRIKRRKREKQRQIIGRIKDISKNAWSCPRFFRVLGARWRAVSVRKVEFVKLSLGETFLSFPPCSRICQHRNVVLSVSASSTSTFPSSNRCTTLSWRTCVGFAFSFAALRGTSEHVLRRSLSYLPLQATWLHYHLCDWRVTQWLGKPS